MGGVAVSKDGIALAFEAHGSGTPTLVFVHGRDWSGSTPTAPSGRPRPPTSWRRSQLTTPVAAINPDARPTDIEALRRHGVTPVLMPRVGHFLMLEDPDRFNRLLSEVIDGMGR